MNSWCFRARATFAAWASGHSYGLSARGLAIGTGSSRPEEFPLFRAFWIERPRHAQSITVHALLDSPSVTGAYTFQIWPGAETRMDVAAELFPRCNLTEVGLAPLTSMFLKNSHDDDGPADFRPAVHDSEGLAVWNARGERLWRPLVSPRQVQKTTLLDDNLRGFGLIQRARSFAAYEDLEANYHTRPSAWVEPRKTWGDGAVQLVELPAAEEYYDNIVAFWRPIAGLKAGVPYVFAYRLTWADDTPARSGYRVVKTRVGRAGTPHHIRFIVDFAQTDRRADSKKAEAIRGPDPIASVRASHGVAGRPHVQQNFYTGGVRVSFEFDPAAAERSDLRLELEIPRRRVQRKLAVSLATITSGHHVMSRMRPAIPPHNPRTTGLCPCMHWSEATTRVRGAHTDERASIPVTSVQANHVRGVGRSHRTPAMDRGVDRARLPKHELPSTSGLSLGLVRTLGPRAETTGDFFMSAGRASPRDWSQRLCFAPRRLPRRRPRAERTRFESG